MYHDPNVKEFDVITEIHAIKNVPHKNDIKVEEQVDE